MNTDPLSPTDPHAEISVEYLSLCDQKAGQVFFYHLRKWGRLRLACAAAGWTRSQVHTWMREKEPDGSANRKHRPEFALAVEKAIGQFQGKMIELLLDDREDRQAGRWRMPAWVLERFFGTEYARKAARPAPQSAGNRSTSAHQLLPFEAANPDAASPGFVVTLAMQEQMQAAQREFQKQQTTQRNEQNYAAK